MKFFLYFFMIFLIFILKGFLVNINYFFFFVEDCEKLCKYYVKICNKYIENYFYYVNV